MCLDNEVERIHAIKLIRKIAQVAPQKLSSSLVYPLVAIGNDGNNERDRMVRISLATICEIGMLLYFFFTTKANFIIFKVIIMIWLTVTFVGGLMYVCLCGVQYILTE